MNIVEPAVQLLAHTAIVPDAIEQRMEIQEGSTDAETLTVYAGRSCYESWSRPNEKTREDKDYIARTLHAVNHWSISEHATATFYITGVSRALTHELVRHRHLSYSQLSQRFVDESEANIVIPPAARGSEKLMWEFENAATGARHSYRELVEALLDSGLPRKQAREAARAVLPNMIETRIVVTGNMRAWHEVIARRTAPDADAEFQQVAGLIRDELKKLAPAIFKD